MAEQLYTWTPAQFRAHEVLIAHQQTSTSGCHCGQFGNEPSDLGKSYPGHVIDELTRAGIALALDTPDADATTDRKGAK
ncbi:MAG TPA: hypothetical protein VFV01_17080 [Spirillospora sp.]|nr:hypothetical protein [Spirillospora sp.]